MKINSHATKCPHCMTWNEGVDYCTHCNALINSVLLAEMEKEKKRLAVANRQPNKTDIFVARIKESDNWFVKGTYYLFNSIWLVFVSIVSFIIALIALAPG